MQEGIVRPTKFAVAFTLFCNFSKGIPAIFETDLCGRWTFGMVFEDNIWARVTLVAEAVVGLIFMCLIFMALFLAAFAYAINKCCCGGGECCCTRSKCLVFTGFRIVLLLAVLALTVSRISRFNFDISFDWNYPQWFLVSAISWADHTVSAMADIYFGCFAKKEMIHLFWTTQHHRTKISRLRPNNYLHN